MSIQASEPVLQFNDEEKEVLLEFFPRGVVAMDMESTGLSPLTDHIVELSAIKITRNEQACFDHLIKPDKSISKESLRIHGITDEMVKNKPDISSIIPLFLDFVKDLPLVAHNAGFDMGFLMTSLNRLDLTWRETPVYCSCRLARKVLRNKVSDKKLFTLAKHFKIPSFHSHRALGDAAACLHVYANCLLSCGRDKKAWDHSRLYNLGDFQRRTCSIPPRLKCLSEHISSKTPLEIKYSRGGRRHQFRPVQPCSLLPLPTANVLYAYCFSSEKYKYFYLERITGTREMKERSSIPEKKKNLLKNVLCLEWLLILPAHILLLFWILYILRESGGFPMKDILMHFIGMAVYGTVLIWFTAFYTRKKSS